MASSKKAKAGPGVFVALLRGVNVGGNNMISMKALKQSFESLGYPHVDTYINSGNIIFTSNEADARKLETEIEAMLVRDYQLESKVVVRTLDEMAKLVKSLPSSWNSESDWRYSVIFLRHTIDSKKILGELPAKSEIEEVVYKPGALLWSAQVSALTRSNMVKLPSRKLYQEMTVRNLNTTKKLHELMQKVEPQKGTKSTKE